MSLHIDPRCPEGRPIRHTVRHRKPSGQMEMALRKPPKLTANELIRRHLTSVLPSGVPSMYRQMEDAAFEGLGRRRKAIARLTMVDGLTATVEVFGWGPGCSGHRWVDWQGADLYFDGGEWRREHESAQVGRAGAVAP